MQESGLTDIIPLMCISAVWGQYSVFWHPECPQELTVSRGCSLTAARWHVFFCFLSSLRAHQFTVGSGCNLRWWCHSLFTDIAGNIPFITFNNLVWRWDRGLSCSTLLFPSLLPVWISGHQIIPPTTLLFAAIYRVLGTPVFPLRLSFLAHSPSLLHHCETSCWFCYTYRWSIYYPGFSFPWSPLFQ